MALIINLYVSNQYIRRQKKMSKSKYCICVGACVQHEIWENKSKPSFALNGKQKLGTICQITKHTIEKFNPKK